MEKGSIETGFRQDHSGKHQVLGPLLTEQSWPQGTAPQLRAQESPTLGALSSTMVVLKF